MSTEPNQDSPFDSIESAIADIAAGKMVIVTDDEARENEGDLIMAASKVTPQAVNQMILHARGLICVPMMSHQLRRLGINPMASENRESHQTDFTISVDAAEGITTGISAYDRAETIRILSDPKSKSDQLVQPGHVFPLRAKPGGVLQRAGHTEAAVDLAQLAGLNPSGVICEILNEDGTLARLPDLIKFKAKHDLKLICIADLIEYRHTRDKLIEHVLTKPFESEFGTFDLHIFRSILDNRQHLALSMGELNEAPTLVRVQSENLLGDIFRSKTLGGYNSLNTAMERIAQEGQGVLLYIEQPQGGIRVIEGSDDKTVKDVGPTKMDFRDYGIGAQILVDLGLKQIRLMSSTQRKVVGIDGYDLEIIEQIEI
ncbi:3,4-dihydroxy-2-butanone-4-phosphate synthase [Coraliomargarita sp. SDUM461003]|uniref:3,4-dihydroxy-2-butanone 4-phosphate synthase n=1 Tax=Thalassobacterium maritimum TaxID=3041265 RepID=A0ABU1AQN7_9BACT|nr:3,4-dihydroxy-2-butanone-4-phosphate synthase [Coraliomargarita sp. SDUM461003]MBT64422.1 3,4-dihydroxy-2-butanone-4-phosphate synthase [Puniceicoccaceae bacterium]MDQ8206461.1 3,4-dihydroxy-2-butanone-4-phosphate synthase [Coraliomargarita sp. SDUM461003]HBR94738.1 3,4-dihydroxy-2-butanone-4-phosphate synthase [Opitutae bacterium]|tara:strand:- start:26529 stop:27644 length:1116 start_codon:yes stop_codon:yes gene_type:complete